MKSSNPDFNYKTDEWNTKRDYEKNPKLAWRNPANIINAGFGLVRGISKEAYDMESQKPMNDTLFGVRTVEKGDGVDTFNCENTYEIAIPWTTILANYPDFKVEANVLLGMSAGVLNSNGADINSLLAWGSGIFGGQAKNARRTSGGSNAVTLSAEIVTPAAEYDKIIETETPETTEAP